MTVGTFTGALQPSLNERRCDDRSLDSSHRIDTVDWAVSVRFRALPRNVSAVATGVANLAAGIHRAFSRDVTELSTSIALHGLCLTIASIVVRAPTFVAGSRTRSASETTPEATGCSGKATTGNHRPTSTHR